MLHDALMLLEAFGKASGVARSASLYAGVSAAHIVGIALLFGSLAAIDLRLMGLVRAIGHEALAVLRRFTLAGLMLSIATGIVLASTKPFEYAANPYMQWKLAMLVIGILNALGFELWSSRIGITVALSRPQALRFGLGSLLIWLCVIWLGRMVAFA